MSDSNSDIDHVGSGRSISSAASEAGSEPATKPTTEPDRELSDEEYTDLLIHHRLDESVSYEDLAHMAGFLYEADVSASDLEAVDTGERYPHVSDRLEDLVKGEADIQDQHIRAAQSAPPKEPPIDPTDNVRLQYENYRKRRAKWYPDQRELSFDEFQSVARRWDNEYYDAFNEGQVKESDWATINELEKLLCVPLSSRMLVTAIAALEPEEMRKEDGKNSVLKSSTSDLASAESSEDVSETASDSRAPTTDASTHHNPTHNNTDREPMTTDELLQGLRSQRKAINDSLESIDKRLEQYRKMRKTLDEAIALLESDTIIEGDAIAPLLGVVKQLHGTPEAAADSGLPDHLVRKLSAQDTTEADSEAQADDSKAESEQRETDAVKQQARTAAYIKSNRTTSAQE